MLICSFCGDIWPWTQSTTNKSMMLKLHFDLHICRLSTGVECVCWTNRLSGRQTKLLSCPVVSARDLKKNEACDIERSWNRNPFFTLQGLCCQGLEWWRDAVLLPCRRRFLIEEAEAVEIIPGAQMAILRRLKQVLRWSPDDIRS